MRMNGRMLIIILGIILVGVANVSAYNATIPFGNGVKWTIPAESTPSITVKPMSIPDFISNIMVPIYSFIGIVIIAIFGGIIFLCFKNEIIDMEQVISLSIAVTVLSVILYLAILIGGFFE